MINSIILRYKRDDSWLKFESPHEVVTAWKIEEVQPRIEKIQGLVKEGYYACGFISYEAASGFDKALTTKIPSKFPLLCFGLFDSCKKIETPSPTCPDTPLPTANWLTPLDEIEFTNKIDSIKERILVGDTYQVNFSMQQRMSFTGDPWQLFTDFASDAPYAAFMDLDDYAICSASPELFFELHQGSIHSRPMKGTAPRGRTLAEDKIHKAQLLCSAKDRAENTMIVDLIRNDMAKIAEIGSVTVDKSFQLEKYPTVWQMTSRVSARTTASISEILRALFPCGSITGTPKVNTMRIIDSLEDTARDIYTGCIGFFTPQGDAQFSVAIRTALVDKKNQSISYGIGAGIVWDSVAAAEYKECHLKARVINTSRPANVFSLIETILWNSSDGYFLLDYHLQRMGESAEYFDINFDPGRFQTLLKELESGFDHCAYKVRVLLDRVGEFSISAQKIEFKSSGDSKKVGLSAQVINSDDPYLYHKTTWRQLYETTLAASPDCDDMLFLNERGEITESTMANLVIRQRGKLITPPVSCGLLGGTFRQFLLDKGEITEGIITRHAMMESDEIYLINSVRKWLKAELVT